MSMTSELIGLAVAAIVLLITSSGLNELTLSDLSKQLRRTDKATRTHAMGMALGTARFSVVFAGVTVVIALAALTVIGVPFLSTQQRVKAGV